MMHLSLPKSILALMTTLTVTLAQTPPGFEPATANGLQVRYGNQTITAGAIRPQASLNDQPVLAVTPADSSPYIVFMIDTSVVLQPGSPATTLIHWLDPGLSAAGRESSLTESAGALAPYLPPAPPPGQTHTYVFLLYRQPTNFTLPDTWTRYFSNITASTFNRIGFNLTEFTRATGLGGEPVAANWLRVSSATNSSSTGTATPTRGGPTSVPTSSAPRSLVLGDLMSLVFAAVALTIFGFC